MQQVSQDLQSGLDPQDAARNLDSISNDLKAEQHRVEGLEKVALIEPETGRSAAEGA
jgi:hypothetical protein